MCQDEVNHIIVGRNNPPSDLRWPSFSPKMSPTFHHATQVMTIFRAWGSVRVGPPSLFVFAGRAWAPQLRPAAAMDVGWGSDDGSLEFGRGSSPESALEGGGT
jgi:hypothetical protein